MRFLKAVALGLLASQAHVASALKSYTLGSSLTCSSNTDTVHFDYSLQGLDTPPNFPGTDIYEVAYRLTYKSNNGIVSVPVTTVAAQDGTGRSEIQQVNGETMNKDNIGATLAGQTTANGTILHHQQVNGVSQVTGFFEVSAAAATQAGITCTNSNPNIQLTPLQYAINGINALVLNSYAIAQSAYAATVGGAATAANPVYSFDVNPALNIDSCYTDANTGHIRVPWRVGGLAILADNERGIVSLLVTNPNGDLVSSWTLANDGMQIGTAQRDPAEPSIIQASQPNGPTQVYGRLDFQPTDPAVTCSPNGITNLIFQVVDYSTINLSTGTQTFHFIPGAQDFGLNPASQLPANATSNFVAAAATATPAPPSAAKVAARNAQAKKCAAKAKAAAAAADAAAQAKAAAAAAAPVPGTDTPCLLTVPANPLSAAGLATPYILGGGCTMADTAGFVQAVWISPATGTVQMYNPLVIQQGKQAAVKPQQPTLPNDAVVGLWFGSNANLMQLQAPAGAANTLQQANCVNGAMINGKLSIFGQIAACNAPAFFQAAAIAVFQGLLTVPALGTAIDQMPCPTTRSFFLIDQDPADNLSTQYLLDFNGNTAVNTPGNLATLTAAAKAAGKTPPTVLVNPGDNPLLNRFVNPAMKCNSWMVTDLSNPGTMSFNQATNELSAAFKQGSPVARQPALNPMCANNGVANMAKLNACRSMIGEAPVQNLNQASTATYCKNMVGTNGAVRLLGNQKVLAAAAGPNAGQSLFAFLQDRFAAAVGPANLGCGALVPGLTNPLAGGAVIAAKDAFAVADALLVGSQSPDNQPMDPVAELSGQPIADQPTTAKAFPVAIVAGAVGGAVVLLVASMVIFKVVQRRKSHTNVKATTARECKV